MNLLDNLYSIEGILISQNNERYLFQFEQPMVSHFINDIIYNLVSSGQSGYNLIKIKEEK